MHKQVYEYVRDLVSSLPYVSGKVLEVGSYNVNGTVRDIFDDRDRFPQYVGIDMRIGPDVDLAANSNLLPFKAWSFSVVVCCETLEHDRCFWRSLAEFGRVLVPEGILIITTRDIGFHKHDYPHDYYRFTEDGLRSLFEEEHFLVNNVISSKEDKGVMGWGMRGKR